MCMPCCTENRHKPANIHQHTHALNLLVSLSKVYTFMFLFIAIYYDDLLYRIYYILFIMMHHDASMLFLFSQRFSTIFPIFAGP
jgi:esterase/lipase superfamily enzyme